MTWTNNGPYSGIEIFVDGALDTTLPPGTSAYTVTGLGPGLHTLCVAPIAAAALPQTCCDVQLAPPPPPPGMLGCDPIAGSSNVAMAWSNPIAYSSINITVDGTVVATLPGTDTFFVAPALGPGSHILCVEAFVGGIAVAPVCCGVVLPGPTAPPSDLLCDWIAGTSQVALAWMNNGGYGGIQICVDGFVVATLPGTATSYTITPISTGTYDICVKAFTPSGTLIGEDCCTVTVPGSGPSDLFCDPIFGTASVAMAWTNNGAYASIEICVDGVVVATLPGSATFFTVTGLSSGPHVICVKAYSSSGTLLGEECCTVGGGGIPGPSDLNCDPIFATASVAMAWTNGGGYASIEVCVDGVVVATLPGGETFFTVTGLSAGPHEICVKAYNAAGSLLGEECCTVVVPGIPGPSDLGCDPIFGSSNVALAWTNGGAYASIEICVDGVLWTTVAGADESVTITGVPAGPHELCVKAYDSAGVLIDEICCTVTVIAPPATFVRGDCNANGTFDLSDIIGLLGFLFGSSFSPPCHDACDMNDDGAENIADAIAGLLNLFGAGAPIPAPHPMCGPDPTADLLDCVSFPPCP